MATPLISHTPISEHRKLTRERVFALLPLRPDFKDVVAQFILVLEQLHAERVTGSLTINFSQGSVANAKITESQQFP